MNHQLIYFQVVARQEMDSNVGDSKHYESVAIPEYATPVTVRRRRQSSQRHSSDQVLILSFLDADMHFGQTANVCNLLYPTL